MFKVSTIVFRVFYVIKITARNIKRSLVKDLDIFYLYIYAFLDTSRDEIFVGLFRLDFF